MKPTQKKWVENQLKMFGRVGRNEALRNFITRLGAIVNLLKREGWEVEGGYEKTEYGRDYVYYLQDNQGSFKL